MIVGIFTGGKNAPKKVIKKFLKKISLDYIIAADSGLQTVDALKLVPNFILGDFDSLDNKDLLKKYQSIKTQKFIEDKDFTDTELAMNFAKKILQDNSRDEVVVFGAGGGKRVDHLIYFLRSFKNDFFPSKWIFNTGIAFCICSRLRASLKIKLPLKNTLSIFNIPLENERKLIPKIKSDGLHWKLEQLDWNTWQSISNRNDKTTVSLKAVSGRFLVVVSGHNLQLI